MGNFERLSVLVIVVIIVMIVVIALVQLTGGDEATPPPADAGTSTALTVSGDSGMGVSIPPIARLEPRPSAGPAPAKPSLSEFLNPQRPTVPPDAPVAAPVAPLAEAPTPPKPVEDKVHVVQSGETIARIAKSYYPTSHARAVDAIVKANPAVDPARMRVGTKLTIPSLGAGATPSETSTTAGTPSVASKPSGTSSSSIAGGTYIVRKGDTLAAISRRAYGSTTRWQDIWLANYEAIGDDVDAPTAGTRLTLPR